MNKLPVFRTAGRAIGFTLWNSFTIFRLAWLPISLLLAAQIGLSLYIMRLEGETLHTLPNPVTVGLILERVLAFNLAFVVLQMIAFAAVAVSIHRVILFGDRRPGQYFNFAFGKTALPDDAKAAIWRSSSVRAKASASGTSGRSGSLRSPNCRIGTA